MTDHDPSDGDSIDTDGIDRRAFLGGAAGIGATAGIGGLPGVPGGGGHDDPPIDVPDGAVPYVAARRHTNHDAVAAGHAPPEREPVWATMPVDRWLRIEAANAAEHRVNAMLRERGASDLVRAGTRLNGNGELIVDVHVTELETPRGDVLTPDVDVDALRRAVPSTARGRAALPREHRGGLGSLGTATREREHEVAWTRVRQRQQADYFNQIHRPVRGGAAMTESGPPGTTCTPAWHRGLGEYVLVTAGHVIGGVSPGETCYQPDNTWWWNEIGVSEDAAYAGSDVDHDGDLETTFDAATIRMTDAGVDYDLAGYGGGDYDDVTAIIAKVEWSQIYDDFLSDRSYTLQGSNTGRSTGEITWASNEYKIFETDAVSEGGDSGGPHFKEVDGYAYIAGVHNYGPSEQGEHGSGATSLHKVEQEFPITV